MLDEPLKTLSGVARLAGVSHGTIHKAKVIAEIATEAVKRALRGGETARERSSAEQA